MQALKLVRGGAMPLIPAPQTVQVGDYVFTSSIYPVDHKGHAIGVDERLGEAGPSLIAAQTRHCLEALSKSLRQSGSSLERVLKAEVHLADASDFYEFKLVWREYFPQDPPARTAIEVGEMFPFRGVRLNLDAVALAGNSALQREGLRDPDGPDPTEGEAASWAVRAGNLVFCSGFGATNFSTGLAAGKNPRFPNYGSDGVSQAEYFFVALNRVLRQAGTSLEHALEAYLYEPDLRTFNDVDSTWTRYMPVPPGRASMGVKGLLVPGACFAASLTVLVPDRDHVKQESREGIPYHPVQRRKVNYTPTLKAGPWLYIAGKTAGNMETVVSAPAGLPHHYSDIEVQARNVMEFLTRQIESNGSDWNHCHHVRVWLTQPHRDYRGFTRV
ncbi:MAG TPA: RidA family protein, partial [Burkholderiales bacterium]|nr:RidA family protein [Burkholderiales bacterium]